MLASAALLIVALAGEPAVSPGAPSPEAPPAAQQADSSTQGPYADKRISFQLVRKAEGPDFIFPTRLTSVPTMGKSRTPLLGESFYELVGRPDLASAYRARSIRRNALIFSGLAIVVGGTVYGVTAPSPRVDAGPDEFARQMHAQDRAEHIAMAVAASGLVVVGIGAFTNPNPVDEDEMRRLAEQYNERLRTTVGLSAPPDACLHGDAERPRLSFGAGPTPGGALAGVTVAF